MVNKKPCILMILDGWGINPQDSDNAVSMARTPVLDELLAEFPSTQLTCSGEAVGLPPGIMGNSEVGHLNIGAGRIVYQDLLRIDNAIEDGSFFGNSALNLEMEKVKESGTALHLMGLVSDGGVHSQLAHLLTILDMAREKGVERVFVHAITDGRDTSPDSGAGFVKQVQDHIDQHGFGRIATICGRFYAMDRDKRWERNEIAYRLYTEGIGTAEKNPVQAIRDAYGRDETDEFIKPIVIDQKGGAPGIVQDGDAILFFNFRADRARQITRAFTDPEFDGFKRPVRPKLCGYVTMTLYDESFTLPIAFPPVHLNNILGEVVSEKGFKQLRIAETEKYAHVTYFFNGGEETPFPNEDRCMVPSPREVATYDEKPEMSARTVTEELIAYLESKKYDLIILNFANMDMVGHTGIIEAAVTACETVDSCVGEIIEEIRAQKGVALITADHGNAEQMRDADGNPHTAHTLNPVRLILVDDSRKNVRLKEGKLGDIAPTILEIMGIDQPEEMSGVSLVDE